MMLVGIILIVLGSAGLLLQGIECIKKKKIVNGPIESDVETARMIWIPPALAAAVLSAGVFMLAL